MRVEDKGISRTQRNDWQFMATLGSEQYSEAQKRVLKAQITVERKSTDDHVNFSTLADRIRTLPPPGRLGRIDFQLSLITQLG